MLRQQWLNASGIDSHIDDAPPLDVATGKHAQWQVTSTAPHYRLTSGPRHVSANAKEGGFHREPALFSGQCLSG